MTQKPHICVCICTYKRPELLRRLLSNLEKQEAEGLFEYSIVIVDNDSSESARQTAESFAMSGKIQVGYYVEPEQNISLARNKAIGNSKGDFVALIDDDEFPSEQWLLNLYNAATRYKSDGILAPVIPYFEKKPPGWVLKGGFFDRPTHSMGHVLEWWNTRTGNALLRREIFDTNGNWFDPSFGSGGEDRDFFKKKIKEGRVFVWCSEAPVYESVPPDRWRRTILLKRALLRGKMALNAASSKPTSALYSAAAVAVYTICLPIFLVLGHHIFMEYLIKNCDHLGKIIAFFGIDTIKEKYVRG